MGSSQEAAILGGAPRRGKRLTSVFAVLAAVACTALIAAGLRSGNTGEPVVAAIRQPLPVAVDTFRYQDSFERQVSFLGLVRAGRKSSLGFEVPGALATIPVREGSTVSVGDVLATLDTGQLQARRDAASADLRRVEVELKLARLKAERQRNLQATGAVSKEAFDETRLTALALEAQMEAVTARLRGLDIELEKSVLRAPYDGAVARRLVNAGAVVNPGTPVVQLVESGSREAHFGIAAEQVGLLQDGNSYDLAFRGDIVRATLRSVRPDIDPVTLTATAVFELPPAIAAFDGEPVSLLLREQVAVSGGWVPVAALLEGERGLWTALRLKAEEGGYITVRESLEVLEVQGDRAYVRGTLGDGQRFVGDGVHRIAPGTAVAPLEVARAG
jgi:RND family efflux transporter MFP subunit